MEFQHILALGIFSSYFLIILGLLYIILSNLPKSSTGNASQGSIFQWLAAASFIHTWFYMFRFMSWSFRDYENHTGTSDAHFSERIASWLSNTALFEQAWAAVCNHPLNWWWSEQLCLFTVGAWTIFLAVEGRRHSIKHIWSYMLLGQLVAISVASNLFYLALSRSSSSVKPSSSKDRVSLALWLSVVLSMVAIGLSPYTTEKTFLPNLLIMHSFLIIPLLPFKGFVVTSKEGTSVDICTLYTLVSFMSLGLRTRSTLDIISLFPPGSFSLKTVLYSLWEVLHSHPAQSSIGWDVIWTSISLVMWYCYSTNSSHTLRDTTTLVGLSGLCSAGVSGPWIFKEVLEEELASKED